MWCVWKGDKKSYRAITREIAHREVRHLKSNIRSFILEEEHFPKITQQSLDKLEEK